MVGLSVNYKKVYKDFPQNKIDDFYNNVIQELSWI